MRSIQAISIFVEQFISCGISKDEKRRLKEKSKRFSMEDGILMHMRLSGTPCRVIASNTERLHINEYLHSDAVGGSHLGQTTTMNKISAKFWWPGMSNDIREFVRTRQLANTNKRPVAATLHPIDVQDVFHRRGIDLMGLLYETQRGMKYIVVAAEYLTEVKAIPDTSAASVHDFLLELVSRYGPANIIIHEQEGYLTLVKD